VGTDSESSTFFLSLIRRKMRPAMATVKTTPPAIASAMNAFLDFSALESSLLKTTLSRALLARISYL
jgi:hypothetical protein